MPLRSTSTVPCRGDFTLEASAADVNLSPGGAVLVETEQLPNASGWVARRKVES